MPHNGGSTSINTYLSTLREIIFRSQMNQEIRAWAGLGIGSLAVAGVFAFLLALSRIPKVESIFPWPINFFEKGLVIHVVFSFVVWFLVFFVIITTLATAISTSKKKPNVRLKYLGHISALIACVGSILMAISGLVDQGAASLNNYIPVIIDIFYYSGLACFMVSVCLITFRLSANLLRNYPMFDSLMDAAIAASIIFWAAVSCFLLAWVPQMHGTIDASFNENIFWGGGHVLQYLNIVLLISGWNILLRVTIDRELVSPAIIRILLSLCVMPSIALLILFIFLGSESGEMYQLFTDTQYLLSVPVILMAILCALKLILQSNKFRLPWNDIGIQCIFLSLGAFLIGGYFGLFVDGTDTRTPAHYHAVIAAVNVVLMGVFFKFILPIINCKVGSNASITASIWLYACGQILASTGLFLAGGYGVPRKTPGEAQDIEAMGAFAGMYMNGVGGAIAVIGGIMFICICGRSLLQLTSSAMNGS